MSRMLIFLGGIARTIRPRTARAHAQVSVSNVTLVPRGHRPFNWLTDESDPA